MKILITGHEGYIGSKLFMKLNNGINQVLGVDLKSGNDIFVNLPDSNYDYVFHLAAFPSVQRSVQYPSDTFAQNAYATSVLLEWCKNHGVKRFIFSSSAAAASITSPYGLQKRISEQECKLYSELYGLDTVSLRYHNVYSEDQKYGGAYSTVINAWMHMIREKKPLRIDGDGEQTRDFIHVSDVVSANIFCMNYKHSFRGKTFDVATGQSCSLNKIKNIINLNNEVQWEYKPTRKGDIKHSHSCISGLSSIGWNPCISIEDGLKKCFKRSNHEQSNI